MQSTGSSFRQQDRSIRLTFSYEGSQVRLISRQVLNKRPPSSDPLLDPQKDDPQSGFWVELRDREDQAVYRKIMHNPIELSVEVISEDSERTFARQPISDPRGTFFSVIPNLEEAQSVVILSSPLDIEARPEAAREIARFALGNQQEEIQ